MTLDNRVVIVSGAARGIGRATATRLARDGAVLALTDIAEQIPDIPYPLGTIEQLEHTVELCRAEGTEAIGIAADIRSMKSVESIITDTVERFGRIDGVVNNAGVVAPAGYLVHELAEQAWDVVLDINLSGTWRMMRCAAAVMSRQRHGSIVNIASTAGQVGYRGFAAYAASKHGVIGLTRTAALDLGPSGVRVNAVCPGSVRDDPALEGRMLEAIGDALSLSSAEHEAVLIQNQPDNSLVEAGNVAESVQWLLSDASRHITGASLTVDGGYTCQ
jgi:NAD(P)-dependent dehydrogenase (short-subunit alcohol dehydrogenase family)